MGIGGAVTDVFAEVLASMPVSNSSRGTLLSTFFVSLDGEIVVVVMNNTDSAQNFFLWIHGETSRINVAAYSIRTLSMK